MGTTSLSDLSAEQALHLADSLYVDEFYADAIDAYTAAEAVLREGEDPVLHYRIRSHRAAAFLQLERFEEAFDDSSIANKSLEKVTNLRVGETEICWRRQGIAALKLGHLSEALSALEQAQQLAILNQSSTQSHYPPLLEKCHLPAVEEKPAATEDKKPAQAETTTSPSVSSPPAPAPQKNSGMPKYQFWQSDKFMTISILEPNIQLEQLDVNFQLQHLSVVLTKNNQQYTVIAGKLWEEIDPDASQIKLKTEKVVLKLKKSKANYEWPELMSKETIGKRPEPIPKKKVTTAASSASAEESTPSPSKPVQRTRPYASHKDWESIEKDIEQEEAKETPQGDDAMNKLFQQIYQGADEDTRRAMIKSYQTSGGTVLSTNWNEVQEKDYEKERTAPKGMEWKNWEGDKLKQSDD